MSQSPLRWSEQPDAAPARRWVARTAEIAPRPVELEAGWRAVLAGAARPQRDWRLVPALLLSMTVGALGVLAVWPKLRPPPVFQVQAAEDARWHVEGGEVVIDTGHAVFQGGSAEALKVATPHLHLEVLNGRVAADVARARTVLWVQEGDVVVRTADGQRRLKAGASLSWPPAADISERLTPAPAAHPVCEKSPPEGLLSCLELESRGTSLRAEEALYELGLLHAQRGEPGQAIDTWRGSLERFPEGVLHPEVRLALMVALAQEQRAAEAVDVAESFERLCADDPRVVEVVRLRRSLKP
jgi:hypothetical protein